MKVARLSLDDYSTEVFTDVSASWEGGKGISAMKKALSTRGAYFSQRYLYTSIVRYTKSSRGGGVGRPENF